MGETITKQDYTLFAANRFLDSEGSFTSQLTAAQSQSLSPVIPPTLQSEPGPSQPLGRSSIADLISVQSTVGFPLRSFPSSIQECHPKVPYLFPDPPPFVSAVNALDQPCQESFILQRKAACLFVQLVFESWLIVPDTGMLKEYNERLFHSNGPAHHCFFTILTQPGGRKSQASVAVRTDAPICPHTTQKAPLQIRA